MPKNTPKLKVAFVLDDGLDKPDGVQQYILTLGEWLRDAGHEVWYLVGETKRQDIANMITLSKNLKVRFNGNSLSTPFPAKPAQIKKLLANRQFDVIHVQVPYSPFMAAQVVHFAPRSTKIIGTFHILPLGKLQHLGTRALGFSLKFNLKKFDQILSVSRPAQVFAKKTFGINSQVLPNPVDISKFRVKNNKTSNKVNITFLGRLVPRKGCLQLLKAVNLLLKQDDSLQLEVNIGGTGNQQPKLEKYVSHSKLQDIVTFHGFIEENDKPAFLAAADFAVFPSVSGESFGIVLLEAMAAQAGVVLAGNNPGYSSVLADAPDSLFDPQNEHGLANKLHKLIKDNQTYRQLQQDQQQLVEQFDIQKIGTKLLTIYSKPG